MDGFSFHGTHCSALGCYYRPSAKSRGDEMESYDKLIPTPIQAKP